ncbi:MAG: hypothetical protein A2020_09595 [Lentisphaerae bacterium GWF2_45_14]|nr:MAG: hypothetical protein A2020_09595 [Lentisphaerae bacterium GWF2_45_14]
MFSAKSLKFLKDLMTSSGPSGFEEESAAVMRDYLAGFAKDVHTDVMGNTIGVINPKSDFKVMLAGHYDEIGFQIVYISEEGLLYFREVGGIDKITIPGTEVDILTPKGKVSGVIGKKPIHLTKPKEREQALELSDLWIDIGAESAKDAAKIVSIGDPVSFKPNFEMLGKHRIKSKGIDDKIGAFIAAETLRELSSKKIEAAVYCVGTVQEELGLRGAETSAFGINPAVGIAIDVSFTTDTPDIQKKILGDIKFGSGPIIQRSADNNSVLIEKLKKAASAKKIPIQESCGHRASGGTDAAKIQMTRAGVATAIVSIPNRYMHTQVEMCDIRDVENCVKLLTEAIAAMKKKDSFIPCLKK